MNIPVKGIVVHTRESNGSHSHKLYITSWAGRPVHGHGIHGVTSFDVGHQHAYEGLTQPAPSGVQHTHHYCTVTTFDDGHTHVIDGVTGPAVPVPGGGHIHYFEGSTTVNGATPHAHHYGGNTGNEVFPG